IDESGAVEADSQSEEHFTPKTVERPERVGIDHGGVIQGRAGSILDARCQQPLNRRGVAFSGFDLLAGLGKGPVQGRVLPPLGWIEVLIPRAERQAVGFAHDWTDPQADRYV